MLITLRFRGKFSLVRIKTRSTKTRFASPRSFFFRVHWKRFRTHFVMHLPVHACARARPHEFAWRIATPKEPRDGKGQQVTLYFRRETRRWLKKKFISASGESIRCNGDGREGDGAPPPLKYLCRMTSHFWNPAVYYKVLCTGTMTRAQTVTEATVITRKMVVRSRRW